MSKPAGRNRCRFLDPRVLARISRLELRARVAVEGFLSGIHHSPYRGQSVEFADYRSYSQGDDIRNIDWKVFARTDKYYIKEYEQETNLNCMILLDDSESMSYRSPGAPMSKLEYASSAAASVAYLALRQHDAVGLALFNERITQLIRSSNKPAHWRRLIECMEQAGGKAKTGIGGVLNDAAEHLSRRALVVLISDLFDEVESVLTGLRRLRYDGHEVIVWHIWDPAELSFPFQNLTLFEGMESLGRLTADPRAIRSRYLEEVEAFTDVLRRRCRQMRVDYTRFDTSAPLDGAISAYLATRRSSQRHRSSRVLGASRR